MGSFVFDDLTCLLERASQCELCACVVDRDLVVWDIVFLVGGDGTVVSNSPILVLVYDDLADELVRADGFPVDVEFEGLDNEPAGGAGSRYGFVAIDYNGKSRYSNIYTDHDNQTTFDLQPNDSAVFMVVTSAGTRHVLA